MKRATITLPDELATAIDRYTRAQENPPPLTRLVQSALRQYLRERGYLRAPGRLRIRAAAKGSGYSDVSEKHDRYLAGR
ncbi:MAG: hypothetical protein ACRD0Y_03915 [Terriglobales bacterium]